MDLSGYALCHPVSSTSLHINLPVTGWGRAGITATVKIVSFQFEAALCRSATVQGSPTSVGSALGRRLRRRPNAEPYRSASKVSPQRRASALRVLYRTLLYISSIFTLAEEENPRIFDTTIFVSSQPYIFCSTGLQDVVYLFCVLY